MSHYKNSEEVVPTTCSTVDDLFFHCMNLIDLDISGFNTEISLELKNKIEERVATLVGKIKEKVTGGVMRSGLDDLVQEVNDLYVEIESKDREIYRLETLCDNLTEDVKYYKQNSNV